MKKQSDLLISIWNRIWKLNLALFKAIVLTLVITSVIPNESIYTGGGLVANISTIKNDYSLISDSIDNYSFIPDMQILVSGAISMIQDAHKGSQKALLGVSPEKELCILFSVELNVNEDTPPAFITCASNDPVVNPLNSLRYYEAIQKQGIKSCLHIFTDGKHSIALRNNPGATNLWTQLCEAWLNEIGFISNNN